MGVVGIFTPWNYPLTLAASDVISALMAGNSVVLKPAEETPFSALYAMYLMREAGLPQETYQIVTGKGRTISQVLIEGIDFFAFTGSTETGRSLARLAGEQLINYSLELGGKNPLIVLDDADLGPAVDAAIRGSFSNAGQLCVAFERIYVQNGLYDRFLEALLPRVKALRMGRELDYSADMGTLISQAQLDRVDAHVKDAVAKGATLLAGGKPRPDLGPYFYEPTVLAGVIPGMQVYAEETFGPVTSVYRFDTVEDAIRLANDSCYGLNAAVWTRDVERGKRIARRIQTGMVNVNESYAATWGSVDAPMGGMKDSGIARRHGREGILKFTESQTVSVQRFMPVGPSRWLKPRYFAIVFTLFLLLMKRIPGLR
jgi:succinate-semialdehyde dehydrogenase/glutarate-semialdehyde dehydrogenase